MPSAPIANSVTFCETFLPGIDCVLCDDNKIDSGTFSNVLVIPGLDCSLNQDVIVTGNIHVESGAEFSANDITIFGNVISDGASRISVTGATVTGNIQIENSDVGSVVVIGTSTIGGNLLFKNNEVSNSVYISQNTINGNFEFSENTSKRGSNNIGQNTISYNRCTCRGNRWHNYCN